MGHTVLSGAAEFTHFHGIWYRSVITSIFHQIQYKFVKPSDKSVNLPEINRLHCNTQKYFHRQVLLNIWCTD